MAENTYKNQNQKNMKNLDSNWLEFFVDLLILCIVFGIIGILLYLIIAFYIFIIEII